MSRLSAKTIPGFESGSWQGFFVPAGTPRDIVMTLQRETAKVLKLPEVIARLDAGGNEGVGSTPEEFDARFKGDIAKFAKIVEPNRKSRSRTEPARHCGAMPASLTTCAHLAISAGDEFLQFLRRAGQRLDGHGLQLLARVRRARDRPSARR